MVQAKSKEIKRGEIAVNKKRLTEHLQIVQDVEKCIDEIMKEKETTERGKKIAKQMNRLTFSRHSILHFDLNIDLKKLK